MAAFSPNNKDSVYWRISNLKTRDFWVEFGAKVAPTRKYKISLILHKTH